MCILFFYSTSENHTLSQLEEEVSQVIRPEDMEVHHNLESLTKSLSKYRLGGQIAVLCAANREELSEFMSISDLLEKVSLVLILPDRDKETLREGLKLYPRFWDYQDGNSNVVAAVLSKMVRKV